MRRILFLLAISALACGADDSSCPDGGKLIGVTGVERWCAIDNGHGGWTKHGPYSIWDTDRGHLQRSGQYCHGAICGTWLVWRDTGDVASEIHYTETGEPCGTWIHWDEDGNETASKEYDTCLP